MISPISNSELYDFTVASAIFENILPALFHLHIKQVKISWERKKEKLWIDLFYSLITVLNIYFTVELQ